MNIREALSQLDTLDDDLWTSEGYPKIDAVKELLGRSVTRQEIVEAAPQFSRSNPIVEEEKLDEEASEDQPKVVFSDDPELISNFAQEEPVDVNSFLGFLNTVPTDQLEELKSVLDKQKQGVRDSRSKLDEYELRINGALTMTKARIKREIPDISDREANQDYLKSQADLRAKKKMATAELLKGMDISSLDPRAPIDRAFARKTARGTQRPGS